jgi:hypothetical protein
MYPRWVGISMIKRIQQAGMALRRILDTRPLMGPNVLYFAGFFCGSPIGSTFIPFGACTLHRDNAGSGYLRKFTPALPFPWNQEGGKEEPEAVHP